MDLIQWSASWAILWIQHSCWYCWRYKRRIRQSSKWFGELSGSSLFPPFLTWILPLVIQWVKLPSSVKSFWTILPVFYGKQILLVSVTIANISHEYRHYEEIYDLFWFEEKGKSNLNKNKFLWNIEHHQYFVLVWR